jgi:O-methyltransferase
MRTTIIRIIKSLFFNTFLWKFFLPVMKFDMSIKQLNFILDTIKEIDDDGAIVEIGVGGGASSIVINKFIQSNSINKHFFAIDTFYGFTKEDISYENKIRGKADSYQYYRSNSLSWYTKTLKAHGILNANIFKADAKDFEYNLIGPIAFCLFDVDLYNPTSKVLPILYSKLIPGGVIIVDDCQKDKSIYDGAGEAYREFCKNNNLTEELVHYKLGVIRKPK